MSELRYFLTPSDTGGFTESELITAGEVLGVLGDNAQQRAIAALRTGELESAEDQQHVADILRGMDVERLFQAGQ